MDIFPRQHSEGELRALRESQRLRTAGVYFQRDAAWATACARITKALNETEPKPRRMTREPVFIGEFI